MSPVQKRTESLLYPLRPWCLLVGRYGLLLPVARLFGGVRGGAFWDGQRGGGGERGGDGGRGGLLE